MLLLFLEKLTRRLPVVVDLFLIALALSGISHRVQIDAVLISYSRVGIETPLGVLVPLFAPEYVVYPTPQILTHIVRLKGFSEVDDKLIWIVLAPGRQLNVIDSDPVLLNSEVDPILIHEHFGAIEEFGDELADVSIVVQGAIERVLHRMETPIWGVQALAMQLN